MVDRSYVEEIEKNAPLTFLYLISENKRLIYQPLVDRSTLMMTMQHQEYKLDASLWATTSLVLQLPRRERLSTFRDFVTRHEMV